MTDIQPMTDDERAMLVAWATETTANGNSPLGMAAVALLGLDARCSAAEGRVPRWIPVSERIPEACQDVLAIWWQDERCIAFFDDRMPDKIAWWYHGTGGLKCAIVPPTHWMPLPSPPAARTDAAIPSGGERDGGTT